MVKNLQFVIAMSYYYGLFFEHYKVEGPDSGSLGNFSRVDTCASKLFYLLNLDSSLLGHRTRRSIQLVPWILLQDWHWCRKYHYTLDHLFDHIFSIHKHVSMYKSIMWLFWGLSLFLQFVVNYDLTAENRWVQELRTYNMKTIVHKYFTFAYY